MSGGCRWLAVKQQVSQVYARIAICSCYNAFPTCKLLHHSLSAMLPALTIRPAILDSCKQLVCKL